MVARDGWGMVMVRALYTIGVMSFIGAGILFGLCAACWLQDGRTPERVELPSAMERYSDVTGSRDALAVETASPLIREAKVFSSYLQPVPSPAEVGSGHAVATQSGPPVTTAFSPPAASPRFRLHGTSYCPWQPHKSMALVSVQSGRDSARKWVKEGSEIGHFAIQEIRPGAITYRKAGSEQLHEMSVEPGPLRSGLVRGYIPELARGVSPSAVGRAASEVNVVGEAVP